MVINVEYNQLDPLLRATGYPDGDTNSETGYSPYPGNINQVNYIFFFSNAQETCASFH
jgi:UDP-sugar pyrophosphorylase